jgi:hypothetical protein
MIAVSSVVQETLILSLTFLGVVIVAAWSGNQKRKKDL